MLGISGDPEANSFICTTGILGGGGWTTPNLCLTTWKKKKGNSSIRHPFFLLATPSLLILLGGVFLIVNSWHRQDVTKDVKRRTRWWQLKYFLIFIPTWERFPFWLIFFKRGWFNHQPEE